MIWHLDHVVWAIALTLATTPTPTPEPVTVPVVVTSSMTEAAPQPVADPAPVVDVDAVIARHASTLRDLHVAVEATLLALSIHGDTVLAAEWAQQDLESARRWQAEWTATGIVHEGITGEYADLVGVFERLLVRVSAPPVTLPEAVVDDYTMDVGGDGE